MTKRVYCGNVAIGGGAPVSIQSMLNVDTRNIPAATEQIAVLADAGCEIVRLAVPDMEAAKALKDIKKKSPLPIVADIHFDYRLAIEAIKAGADKVRVNPGNIGDKDKVKAVVEEAKARGIPIRIGVNGGSLEKNIKKKHGGVTAAALVESAMAHVAILEELDFRNMVISLKASQVPLNYKAYIEMSKKVDYPLHIGVTEAGTLELGRIKSAVGIGGLLLAGIGDTLRVSLTGDPVEEIFAAQRILSCVGMRNEAIEVISCPTCGRTKVDLTNLAVEVERLLIPVGEKRREQGKNNIKVAVMGCEVNGPGEASDAHVGVACGNGRGVIFVSGKVVKTVKEEDIVREMMEVIDRLP